MATVRIRIIKPTASGRRTGWWKKVTGIDRSKKGGWCLEGEFLNEGEQDIPVGSVLVECTPVGSVKNGWKAVSVYIVGEDDLDLVKGEGCDKDGDFNLHKQTPSLLDCIELAFDLRRGNDVPLTNPLAAFTTEQLLAELERRKANASTPNRTYTAPKAEEKCPF